MKFYHISKFGKSPTTRLVGGNPTSSLFWPQVVVRQLPKVAESGLVRVPSKYSEVSRHDAPPLEGSSRKHRGAMHHRWIFTVQENDLLAIPKLPYLEHDESFKEVEEVVANDPWLINWPTVMGVVSKQKGWDSLWVWNGTRCGSNTCTFEPIISVWLVFDVLYSLVVNYLELGSSDKYLLFAWSF